MWYLAVFIATAVLAFLFLPQPEIPQKAPEEFQDPTSGEGDEIPVLFGSLDIKSPNIVWYGDIKTVAIRQKGGKK